MSEPNPEALREWSKRLEDWAEKTEAERSARLAYRETAIEIRGLRIRLPDDALVLRGGVSSEKSIRRALEKTHRRTGHWAVSGAAGVDIDVETLLGVYPLPHASIRQTTAGVLRDNGFEPVPTGPPGHCTIFFPVRRESPRVTDDLIYRFRDLLDPPEPNPVADRYGH